MIYTDDGTGFEVVISNHGRITIPSPLRRKYGLKDGDKLFVIEDEEGIRIIPIPEPEELGSIVSDKEIKEIIVSIHEERNLERKRNIR